MTAAVATSAPCTGELRGIITGTTGRAKVLTRISSTQYLVYGGRSPVLAGTVTDGVGREGTVTGGTGSGTVIDGAGTALVGSGVEEAWLGAASSMRLSLRCSPGATPSPPIWSVAESGDLSPVLSACANKSIS